MIELMKQVVTSPTGSFGFVFALVMLIALFAFWIHGKFVTMIANHANLAEQCAATKDWSAAACDRLDKRIEAIRDDLHAVKADVQYIRNMINLQSVASVRGLDSMVQAHSPLALTEIRKSAASEMGADKAIAARWETIKAKMDAEIPVKSAYDIQTYCLEKIAACPDQFFDPTAIGAFKGYAFSHGRTLFECMAVVGILVRDAYFNASEICQNTGTVAQEEDVARSL